MGGGRRLWGIVPSLVGEEVGLGAIPAVTSFLFWVSCGVRTAGLTRKSGGFELG